MGLTVFVTPQINPLCVQTYFLPNSNAVLRTFVEHSRGFPLTKD